MWPVQRPPPHALGGITLEWRRDVKASMDHYQKLQINLSCMAANARRRETSAPRSNGLGRVVHAGGVTYCASVNRPRARLVPGAITPARSFHGQSVGRDVKADLARSHTRWAKSTSASGNGRRHANSSRTHRYSPNKSRRIRRARRPRRGSQYFGNFGLRTADRRPAGRGEASRQPPDADAGHGCRCRERRESTLSGPAHYRMASWAQTQQDGNRRGLEPGLLTIREKPRDE